MTDLTIALANRPGALAEMGEALGRAGVSIEGGGAWVVNGEGVAHFLFADGAAAARALEAAGIRVLAQREVLVQRLRQDVPGQVGLLTRRMAEAGVNIEVLYSDHEHQLIIVVDDPVRGRFWGVDARGRASDRLTTRYISSINHPSPCLRGNYPLRMFATCLSALALTVSVITALASWAASRASVLGWVVELERSLANVPTALRFHGVSEDDLAQVGISASEFAYLLANATVGHFYHRLHEPFLRTPFPEGHYRHTLCLSPEFRRAWPLIRRQMTPSNFVRRMDLTVALANEAALPVGSAAQ